ncbi:MAG: hypothetical protein HQ546_05975 [Planctomycetes bacterium]|nr:hypothetical protein [Planctomycetota bacterium]
MTEERCLNSIPRACADLFADMRETLARIESLAKATHSQAAKTNGCAADLFSLVNKHTAELVHLETELKHFQTEQQEQATLAQKLLTAGWRLAVLLAGVVASILGLKHIAK